MHNGFARLVAFACAVSLSLPPGWCCFLGLPTFSPIARAKSACCGCRCSMPKTPERSGTPAAPVDTSRCCCADRNAVQSDDQIPIQAVVPSAMALFPVPPGRVAFLQLERIPILEPPRRILLCEWLC
jgi:hypothetical protein